MKNKLSAAQIDLACRFWANQLRHPRHDMLGSTRHQRRDDASEFSEIMADVVASTNPIPNDQIDRFARALRRRLEATSPPPNRLFVDYNPEDELYEAAREAGLDTWNPARWPWKTKMWFENGGVQVACGYGAQAEEILLDQTIR